MVTFEGRAAATAYGDETGVSCPILVDEERTLYEAYGLGVARTRHLIGPTTLKAYAREALRACGPGDPSPTRRSKGATC